MKASASPLTKTELPVTPEIKVDSEEQPKRIRYVWTELERSVTVAG